MNRYIRTMIQILVCCFGVLILGGCHVQLSDSTTESKNLANALIHPNYDGIQAAAEAGADMDQVKIDGVSQNPILYLWNPSPRPLFIEQLLKNGSDANYADRNGNTLLMYASGYEPQKYGFLPGKGNYSSADYAELFLRYDADVSQQNKEGWTALDYAVQLDDDMAAMNLLLSYGAEVTPVVLSHALDFEGAYTHYQRIHKLVALLDSSQTSTILTPIFDAAIRGDNATVQELATKTDLSEAERLQTLCHAVAFCNADTVRLLLADGFGTIQTIDAADNTLLQIAAMQNNTDVMNFLLKQGSWDTESRDAALCTAIRNNSTEACRLLLDSGTPVITGTVSIWEVFDNIMDGASENGNVEITQMLIQHGYPVNETTAWYAMKNAARTGQTAIIQYWVSLGYDPDYHSDDTNGDSSVLQDACWAEQIETVQYLLDIGCDVNAAQRCLPMAVETGNIALVKLLLEHGAAVDESTVLDDGSAERTPKEGAELYGFGEILELLEQYQQ